MNPPRLVYLGPVADDRDSADRPSGKREPLLHEGRALEPGDALSLTRRRSPWKRFRGAERVIVGSSEERADVLLQGAGVHPEHLRLYLKVDGSPTDLRPMQPGSTRLDGEPLAALAWTPLSGGEEIDVASWRFRYEASSPAE